MVRVGCAVAVASAIASVVLTACSGSGQVSDSALHSSPSATTSGAASGSSTTGPVSGMVQCASQAGEATSNLSGLQADAAAIRSRLTAMGVKGAQVTVDSVTGRITIAPNDRPAATVEAACLDGSFIAPVVEKVTGRPTTPTDPYTPVTADSQTLLSGLTFAVPTTVAELNTLSPQNRRQLDAVLNSVNCAYPIVPSSGALLSCDDKGTVYLLGAPIVTSDDIASATAVAPSATNVAWSVNISLTTRGGTAVARYTTAHNTGGFQPTGAVDDELVVVGAGRAVSLGAAQAPITGGQIQFTGDLTQDRAQRVAATIVPAPLPVPLQIVTVQQFTAAPTPPATSGTSGTSGDAGAVGAPSLAPSPVGS